VREGGAKGLMTSYNRINGVYASESYDLCTRVLRNEWGFDGLVMTDWTTTKNMLDSAKAMQAGVQLMMPGIKSDKKQIKDALAKGTLRQSTIDRNVSFLLGGIVQSQIYEMFKKEHNRGRSAQ
jgi:beta-glucosidase